MGGEFRRGFASLLEILLVSVIVLILTYFLAKQYLHKPSDNFDNQTQVTLTEQGIDASSNRALVDTTREKLHALEEQMEQRMNELENPQ